MAHPALEPQVGHGYGSSKTYCHNIGLSATFRQWRATSHCRFLHGYALQVRVEYGCSALDERNWCQDFGGLKPLKAWLEETFDHKTLVAADDPQLAIFRNLARLGTVTGQPFDIDPNDPMDQPVIQLVVVPSVGVEAFSRLIFDKAQSMITDTRVWVERVTVSEHEGNSAWYGRVNPSTGEISRVIDQAIQRREGSRARTGI